MKQGLSDTSRDADRVQMDLLRAMPPWRRLEMAFALNRTLKKLILADAGKLSPQDRLRYLANRWLGPELAESAYGPAPGQREVGRG